MQNIEKSINSHEMNTMHQNNKIKDKLKISAIAQISKVK